MRSPPLTRLSGGLTDTRLVIQASALRKRRRRKDGSGEWKTVMGDVEAWEPKERVGFGGWGGKQTGNEGPGDGWRAWRAERHTHHA